MRSPVSALRRGLRRPAAGGTPVVRSDRPRPGARGLDSGARGYTEAGAHASPTTPDGSSDGGLEVAAIVPDARGGRVDPAVCAHGGIVFFVKGAVERVTGSAWLCVLHSGIARGTKSAVRMPERLYALCMIGSS